MYLRFRKHFRFIPIKTCNAHIYDQTFAQNTIDSMLMGE